MHTNYLFVLGRNRLPAWHKHAGYSTATYTRTQNAKSLNLRGVLDKRILKTQSFIQASQLSMSNLNLQTWLPLAMHFSWFTPLPVKVVSKARSK